MNARRIEQISAPYGAYTRPRSFFVATFIVGGPVRVLASFNGLVGYKSPTGHYPMNGVFPLSRTLDTMGPWRTRTKIAS